MTTTNYRTQVMEALYLDGLRSTFGRLLPKGRKKGHKAISPGHRPGYTASVANALQGQKNLPCNNAFALTGRTFVQRFNPGRCPGLIAVAPSGRSCCSFLHPLGSKRPEVERGAGRTFVQRFNPGQCPGLIAAAPSGRSCCSFLRPFGSKRPRSSGGVFYHLRNFNYI